MVVTELGIVEPIDQASKEADEARARATAGQTGRKPLVFRLKDKKLVNFPRATFVTSERPRRK